MNDEQLIKDLYDALMAMMHCHRDAHDKEGEAALEKASTALSNAKPKVMSGE